MDYNHTEISTYNYNFDVEVVFLLQFLICEMDLEAFFPVNSEHRPKLTTINNSLLVKVVR